MAKVKTDKKPPSLSTPFPKYDRVCWVDFRFWRGATREHPFVVVLVKRGTQASYQQTGTDNLFPNRFL